MYDTRYYIMCRYFMLFIPCVVGHRRRNRKGMQQDEKNVSINMENMDNNVMSAQKKMLEVSLAGVGTVLRRERDARSMVK